jgi:hypothetical protein
MFQGQRNPKQHIEMRFIPLITLSLCYNRYTPIHFPIVPHLTGQAMSGYIWLVDADPDNCINELTYGFCPLFSADETRGGSARSDWSGQLNMGYTSEPTHCTCPNSAVQRSEIDMRPHTAIQLYQERQSP